MGKDRGKCYFSDKGIGRCCIHPNAEESKVCDAGDGEIQEVKPY